MLRCFFVALAVITTGCVGHYDVPERIFVHVPPDSQAGAAADEPPIEAGARLIAPASVECRSALPKAKYGPCPAVLAPGAWHLRMELDQTELVVPHAPIVVRITPPSAFNRALSNTQVAGMVLLGAGGLAIGGGSIAADSDKSGDPRRAFAALGIGAASMGLGALVVAVSSLLATQVGTGQVRIGVRSLPRGAR